MSKKPENTASESGPEHPNTDPDEPGNTSSSNPNSDGSPHSHTPSSKTDDNRDEASIAASLRKQESSESVIQQPSHGEIEASKNGDDRSGSDPNSVESRPDESESTERRENPDHTRGSQYGKRSVELPPKGFTTPPPPYGYAIPGNAPLYYQYPPNAPGVVQQPLSGSLQPPAPPFAHTPVPLRLPSPTYATPTAQPFPLGTSSSEHAQEFQTPLSGVSRPHWPPPIQPIPESGAPYFFPPAAGSQSEGVHKSSYGYPQQQFNPYPPFPNWSGPPPPLQPPYQSPYQSDSPYPSAPFTHILNAPPYDNTRTIVHRFAGLIFNIRTDAKVGSKKLRVKRVDNHVEYYCSGVLLTRIKYKLERDIFSLYEDTGTEPLKDAKLCEKIEILIGPIVAGLFQDPWNPKDFNFAWGVRDCEGIGDDNSFDVDVLRDVDGVTKYDSPSRQFQQSPSPRSRPIVADMDAFHRIPSVDGPRDLSRTSYVQNSIDHSHLLNVLREIELLTAMELAKRPNLTGPAVASVIGRKDYALFVERGLYRTFSTEVPTLFGLFVSNLSSWSKKISNFASYVASRLHLKGRHRDEEESLGFSYEEESPSTVNTEKILAAPSNLDNQQASHPDSIPGAISADGGVGSEDEDDTTLDEQSLASGDDAIAWGDVGLSSEDDDEGGSGRQSQASADDAVPWWLASSSSEDDDEGGPDRQSQASADDVFAWWKAVTGSEDDDEGGLDRQSPAPNEDANTHLGNNNDDVSISADVNHTERSPTNPHQSINDSQAELSDKPSSTLSFEPLIPSAPVTFTHAPQAYQDHLERCSASQPIASNAEVSGSQEKQLLESQERGTRGERDEGDDDFYSEAEGHTNSQQEKPPNSIDNASHASSAQEMHKQSQGEYRNENEKKMEGASLETENGAQSGLKDSLMTQQTPEEPDISLNEEQIIKRKQENGQTEEEGLQTQDSTNEGSANRDKIPAHEYDDDHHEHPSILRQPHDNKPKRAGRELRFHVPSSEQFVPGRQRTELEDERHRDELNEARHTHFGGKYPSYPRPVSPPAYSPYAYSSPAYAYSAPVQPYQPLNSSSQSSTYSQDVAPSIVEPYQEAVAAGQVYDVPSDTPDDLPKRKDSPPEIPEEHLNVDGSHDHHAHPGAPPPPFMPTDFGALPRPATSSRPSGMFSRKSTGILSRKSSYKSTHDGDTSTESTYIPDDHRTKNRMPLLIAKDTLSVTLGVVIVILSILAVAFDPAGEENWFKRVEEGVFVMFSLGIPVLIAMRSRLTHNLEIMMPSVRRKVRSMRDLEKLNKTTNEADFMKQLQRELLFNEELSMLFSPKNACYKLSRTSGHLVVPERAKYRKVFREVWFFGEEYAYNKILGRAFRYQQKDNVLMIDNESVRIDGVIVHVRRRRGKYDFGSSLE